MNTTNENYTGTGVLLFHKGSYSSKYSHKTLFPCISRKNPQEPFFVAFREKKKDTFFTSKENIYIIFDSIDNIHFFVKEVIGPVSSYDAFQRYEMYSRGIFYSLSKHTQYIRSFSSNSSEMDFFLYQIQFKYSSIQHTHTPLLQNTYTFTIDPNGANDLDDAISISLTDEYIIVSVSIALVAGWVEYFQNDSFLCDPFRTSTLYLPDGDIRPLFPTLLQKKMSLLQQELKPVITTQFRFDVNTKQIIDTTHFSQIITVDKNFYYESVDLLENPSYQYLLLFTQNHLDSTVQDSHLLIAFWMKQTGIYCGNTLFLRNCPAIYRECIHNENIDSLWKSYNATYSFDSTSQHQPLQTIHYVHITSPIRRWVDIWNQSLLLDISFPSFEKFLFHNNGIEQVNNNTRQIKKTQRICNLFYHASQCSVLSTNGIPYFDGTLWNLYLPQFQCWTKIKNESSISFINNVSVPCKIVFFSFQHDIKRKFKIMF